jgi:hypothetical protein
MTDWYVIYRSTADNRLDVITVSGAYAGTEEAARQEAMYSLSSAEILKVTQDISEIPEDLDPISLEDAEALFRDPAAIVTPVKKNPH